MAGVPTFEVAEGEGLPRTNLNEWRVAVAPLFDVEPLRADFEARISSYSLRTVLIGRAAASAQIFRRDEQVIKRSQIDHMMVQLYTQGRFDGRAEARPIAVEAGDICCFDLAFGFETTATDFSNITMIVPKAVLQPLTKSDEFHGLVLRSGETANQLLGAHMREILRICPRLGEDETDAVSAVTIELVRMCLRMPRRQRLAPHAPPGSLVDKVRAFIADNLHDPALDGPMICRAFAISRATLYRHFEPLGGVASVIRNWRLSNVFSELEGRSAEPLHAIARRHGFASEASCARAFRNRYGMSPSAFRAVRSGRSPDPAEAPLEGETELSRWLMTLGREVA